MLCFKNNHHFQSKCDIIRENLLYEATNIVGSDETLRVVRLIRGLQDLRYFSPMNIISKHFCRCLCSVNHKYHHIHVNTADLG